MNIFEYFDLNVNPFMKILFSKISPSQVKNAFEFCKELQLRSGYAEISDDVIWHKIWSKKKFKQFLKNLKNAGIVFGVDLAPGIFPRDIFDLEELTNEAPPTFHNIFE